MDLTSYPLLSSAPLKQSRSMSRLDGLGREASAPAAGLIVKLNRTIEKLEQEKQKAEKNLEMLSTELNECKREVVSANQVRCCDGILVEQDQIGSHSLRSGFLQIHFHFRGWISTSRFRTGSLRRS